MARSFTGLMDGAWPDADVKRAREALSRIESGGARFERLRTRRSGARWFAFVELRVPAYWTVARANEIARAAEQAVADDRTILMVRVVAAQAAETPRLPKRPNRDGPPAVRRCGLTD